MSGAAPVPAAPPGTKEAIDCVAVMQVELMRRYRRMEAADPAMERVQRGIHLSINGIAAGLRNTG